MKQRFLTLIADLNQGEGHWESGCSVWGRPRLLKAGNPKLRQLAYSRRMPALGEARGLASPSNDRY